MAHNTTHRRSLAASMDPTLKRQQQQPKSSTTAHPHPDPTLASSATIQCISKHFSNLYSNHKRLSASSKASVDAHLDSSCPALTKSKSQHGRNLHREGAPIKKSHKHPDFVKRSNDEIKKASKEEPDLEGIDVKRAYGSLSGSEELKKIQKQVVKYEEEEEEEEEVKRPSLSLEMGGGGRRRSFSSSQIELADFFSCNSVKVVSVDMPPFMQIHAVDCARKVYDSLEKFTSKALALSLKKEFDGVYGPAWHCIVGTSFGSFVTHSVGGFIYFSMDHKLYVLLFKTTVQRAD